MKCKKAKWLSEEASQVAEERREMKGKGERERYPQLNSEFQRRARRDKKSFLSKQPKEIEGKNRMGKITGIFKKMEVSREISCKDEHDKGQKRYKPNRRRRY